MVQTFSFTFDVRSSYFIFSRNFTQNLKRKSFLLTNERWGWCSKLFFLLVVPFFNNFSCFCSYSELDDSWLQRRIISNKIVIESIVCKTYRFNVFLTFLSCTNLTLFSSWICGRLLKAVLHRFQPTEHSLILCFIYFRWFFFEWLRPKTSIQIHCILISLSPVRVDAFLTNKLTKLKCNIYKTQREWSHHKSASFSVGALQRTVSVRRWKNLPTSTCKRWTYVLFLATQTSESSSPVVYVSCSRLINAHMTHNFSSLNDVSATLVEIGVYQRILTVAIVTKQTVLNAGLWRGSTHTRTFFVFSRFSP